MAENTAIEWAHHTFSPWFGCTPVSSACDNCYAEDWATRYGVVGWGPHADRRQAADAYYRNPAKWNRKAERNGTRFRVFPSLCDPFDNHDSIKPAWRERFYDEIAATPSLDWLLLTKRPQNVHRFVPVDWLNAWPENVWIGTTVENQAEADRRIPHLLDIPAKVHFLSCEPLLGPVDLTRWLSKIQWVIDGGESGPHARFTRPELFRALRDQCIGASVAYLHKQNGEFLAASSEEFQILSVTDRRFTAMAEYVDPTEGMYRVGKKAAGRILDGRTWDEFPA